MTAFLPVGTSEVLEAEITAWDTSVVADPSQLTWQVSVTTTYFDSSTSNPPLTDPSWQDVTVEDRGTGGRPSWRLLIPAEQSAAGRYGIWVRVVGAQYVAPVRFIGTVVFQ